jgi:hypothetical protein
LLLWGDSGCGKTKLASTAPGVTLFMVFDPDGALTLSGDPNVLVMDLSDRNAITTMGEFRKDDPFGLTKFLNDNPEISTIVLDSMTSLAYMALLEAVSKNRNSTIEQPGIHGYTWRNATLTRIANTMMTITKRAKRNMIFISHEGTPSRDDDGRILSISLMLSEGSANQVGSRINEVWWMRDHNNVRSIAVRPCHQRKPMKTRLFVADKATEFVWHYDPETQVGEGIADWWAAWQANGGKRIPLPTRVSTTSRGGMKK